MRACLRDDVASGPGKLQLDEERFEPSDQEEDERRRPVEDADPLVIDGGHPAPPAPRAGGAREKAPAARPLDRSLAS